MPYTHSFNPNGLRFPFWNEYLLHTYYIFYKYNSTCINTEKTYSRNIFRKNVVFDLHFNLSSTIIWSIETNRYFSAGSSMAGRDRKISNVGVGSAISIDARIAHLTWQEVIWNFNWPSLPFPSYPFLVLQENSSLGSVPVAQDSTMKDTGHFVVWFISYTGSTTSGRLDGGQ